MATAEMKKLHTWEIVYSFSQSVSTTTSVAYASYYSLEHHHATHVHWTVH